MPETNGNANACKQLILSKPLAEFDKSFLESLFASYFDKAEMKQKDPPFIILIMEINMMVNGKKI